MVVVCGGPAMGMVPVMSEESGLAELFLGLRVSLPEAGPLRVRSLQRAAFALRAVWATSVTVMPHSRRLGCGRGRIAAGWAESDRVPSSSSRYCVGTNGGRSV